MEEMLGTSSNNADIHSEFIASKAPNAKSREEEVAALGADAVTDKVMTIFPKDGDVPFLWDYQIKGFFKDACSMLARVPGTKSNKLKAYKKTIDGLIFPKPRRIPIIVAAGCKMGDCQRPLRGQTAQGERISLANSETVPPDSFFVFEVLLMDDGLEAILREWLDYAYFRGLGQWRNSGKGRATWEEVG